MSQTASLTIERRFTKPGTLGYDNIKWTKKDAIIANPMTGKNVFEQRDVEIPEGWSLNAVNIVAQKYFTGTPGTPQREASLKQLIDRVVDTVTRQGIQEGYFETDTEAETFREELKYILATQRAAFNSPVWFNIGAPERAQQASACFILGIEDTMASILNWYTEEGMIFKGGSGSGINLSAIRSSAEGLSQSGGTASGPLSFMRGADSSAGAIKSGGKTRRAAKMVILNVDHPDVEEFIWCKAKEERKARVLRDNGFDMDLDGKDSFSIQYQNANNSVRVTDEFMEAVVNDEDWDLRAVTTGKTVRTMKARNLWRQIAEAAWECADPGLQFDTTINKWHTTPNAGRINGSNPCSEYMHLDNSACNLASLNLLKYLRDDGTFDVDAFKHTVELIFTAQEILVGYSEYPTVNITKNAKAYRELGIGYANLGALLMAQGLPYDSEEGRAQAAAITALLTGHSYATSAKLAKRVGPFAGYQKDKANMQHVLEMHRDAVSQINPTLVSEELLSAAADAWDNAVELGKKYGVRNAQASVLAPTGTIGLMMDCDTTGIEPDLGLVKMKKLVGGGMMSIVNQTVPRALTVLGYSKDQVDAIVAYIDTEKTILGAPALKQEHVNVFACSMGDNAIHYLGHVKMMGAVQPFISGAISKTVNMPESATVEDIEQLHLDSWKLGLKAVAIYRDNCKVAQPLSMAKKEGSDEKTEAPVAQPQVVVSPVVTGGYAARQPLPRVRNSKTFSFTVADCHGYLIVGEYEDGRPGELFIDVAKMGSTLSGLMDSFARSVSYGLQHGVPLKVYIKGLTSISFAPSGITDDSEIRTATSLVDYIFRRLAINYLSFDDRLELGLASFEDMPLEQTTLVDVPEVPAVQMQPVEIPVETTVVTSPVANTTTEKKNNTSQSANASHAPMCYNCGNQTQKAGSCYVCTTCGSTTGCS
ncbi:MAG TPA: vitamin B12-dependent ribonucleotide reductase [Candidatus Saccharibacteria bacterium]|jgi:ribonucleoside-diphosphate reductase alpha chain|nr:vitamin B12-dependent ribonucleotide reductase [Candidatus Saccharibacteria bacterium]